MQYTELLSAMHAGRRYDSFQARRAKPPLPPVLICTPANPFEFNERFVDDIALLARAAAAGRVLPAFTPLGKWRCGERLVACDLSGGPHETTLLPIGHAWRTLFGEGRPLPLWLQYTPGALFAVSREAVLRDRHGAGGPAHGRPDEAPTAISLRAAAFYRALLTNGGLNHTTDGHDAGHLGSDPSIGARQPMPELSGQSDGITSTSEDNPTFGHALDRLWRYVFDPETD